MATATRDRAFAWAIAYTEMRSEQMQKRTFNQALGVHGVVIERYSSGIAGNGMLVLAATATRLSNSIAQRENEGKNHADQTP